MRLPTQSDLLPALVVAFAYLLGAVPFGLLVARAFSGKDVRSVGSGNIGATNVARAAGKKAAALTLILDAAKGALPVWLTSRLFGEQWAALVGGAAFLGHVFPVYLGFKGGKGVATALGVFVVLAPLPSLVGLGVYGVTLAATRVSAIGSLTALVATGIGVALCADRIVLGLFGLVATIVILRHRKNLTELLAKRRKVNPT